MTTAEKKAKAAAYNKEWRAKNKERDRKWHQDYYKKNRAKHLARMKKYHKDYYAANPHKLVEYTYKRKYGLSLEDIRALKHKQKHRCAICQKKKKLNVDHCHKTGIVRGLLCTSCNTALGAFADSPKVVKKALAYLAKKRAA